MSYCLSQLDLNLEHRFGATNPVDGLSHQPDYMQGEIACSDVLLTLIKKLYLADTLSEKTCKVVAQLTVASATSPRVARYV